MKILKRIGIGFLTLIALLALWIGINSIDDAELSEQAKEMLKPLPEVPPEENGYDVISYINSKEFNGVVKESSNKLQQLSTGTEWDEHAAEKLIITHSNIIADATTATEKDSFQTPPPKSSIDAPNYSNFYQVARLLIIKAKLETHTKEPHAAIQRLKIGLNFCQKVMFDQRYLLMSYEIGAHCVSDVAHAIHEFTTNRAPNNDQMLDALALLKSTPSYQSAAFDMALTTRVRDFKMIIDESLSASHSLGSKIHDIKDSEYLRPMEKIRGLVQIFIPKYYEHHNAMLNLSAKQSSTDNYYSRRYCNDVKNLPSLFYRKEESVISYLFKPYRMTEVYIGPYHETFISRCHRYNHLDAITTIIAIQAYQREVGNLPESLNLLVPKYLDRLPIDYFDGQTLRYDREHQWLYSVGTDYIDNGGSASGYTHGNCRFPVDKSDCESKPTYPINWNEYQTSARH